MNIEFKEGVVCYAGRKQWLRHGNMYCSREHFKVATEGCLLKQSDFQLNELHEGYYIPESELVTEEKYNQSVEVFGLFGYGVYDKTAGFDGLQAHNSKGLGLYLNKIMNIDDPKVKLTFNQLMAIGDLKRKMNEREHQEAELMPFGENIDLEMSDANHSELPKSSKKPKSKEAYRILESMGIEWDEAERKWFKINKQWL